MTEYARSILIVLHDLPLGGTERIAIRLANRWAKLGRKVTILCGARRGPLSAMIDEAVEVEECYPAIPRGPGSRRALGREVARCIRQRRPDVLFVPGNFHWPVLPAVADLPRHIRPAIVSQISTPLFRHGRGPARQMIYNLRTRRQFKDVDIAVALSPAMVADANKILGRKITRCVRLPALGDETMEPPRSVASGKTIVVAGRMVREKGFDVALRAFAAMDDDSADLVILGEGPRRAELTALANELGVADRVTMPGYVSDIRPWLDKAKAFLLTSYYEGYAAVIVEALAAGRPVVATDCTPAAFELLAEPGAGAVAPIGDYKALAEGLDNVIRAPSPCPEKLAQSVAGYRIGPISDAYLEIFDTAKAQRTAARAEHFVSGVPRRPSAVRGWRPAPGAVATPLAARRSA